MSTVEAVQYSGELTSVQWRANIKYSGRLTLSTVEAVQYSEGLTLSTVEAVQYSEGLTSVQWRLFSTVESLHQYSTIILEGQFRKVSLFFFYELFRLCMNVQFMSPSMVNVHHEVSHSVPNLNVDPIFLSRRSNLGTSDYRVELRHFCKRVSCQYEHLESVGVGNVKMQA